MSEHKHFDIVAYEAVMRKHHAQTADEIRKRIASGVADKEFGEAQIGFHETIVQAALAAAKLSNDGIDNGSIASAMAVAFGTSAASLISAEPPEEVASFIEWFFRSFNDVIQAAKGEEDFSEGANYRGAVFAPVVPGSRA